MPVLPWASPFPLSNSSGKTCWQRCEVGKQMGSWPAFNSRRGTEWGLELHRLARTCTCNPSTQEATGAVGENYGDPKTTLNCTVRPYLVRLQEGAHRRKEALLVATLITPGYTAIPGVGRSWLSQASSAITRPELPASTLAFPTWLSFRQVCRELVALVPQMRTAIVGKRTAIAVTS